MTSLFAVAEIINILFGFFSPKYCWLFNVSILIVFSFIWIFYRIFKGPNYLFLKYPRIAIQFSSSCSVFSLGGIALVIVGLFNAYWLSILWGIINWFLFSYLSKLFNPLVGRLY